MGLAGGASDGLGVGSSDDEFDGLGEGVGLGAELSEGVGLGNGLGEEVGKREVLGEGEGPGAAGEPHTPASDTIAPLCILMQ